MTINLMCLDETKMGKTKTVSIGSNTQCAICYRTFNSVQYMLNVCAMLLAGIW